MDSKKILCPHCNHNPFRNETGLTWHLEHQHGIITQGNRKAVSPDPTPAETKIEQQSPTEPPKTTTEKDSTGPEEKQQQPGESTGPDPKRSRGATMADFEKLLQRISSQSPEPIKKDELKPDPDVTKLRREIEDRLEARLEVFTERDSWLSERISKLEQILKIDGQ
jgi:hypothetical protein